MPSCYAGILQFRQKLRHSDQLFPFPMQVIFATETLASCFIRERYFLRLFFWIDVVATISMALDAPLIVNRLTHNSDGDGSGAGLPTLTRGKANAVVQRMRSITRVTRILRLMRLVQLYGRYQVRTTTFSKLSKSSSLRKAGSMLT